MLVEVLLGSLGSQKAEILQGVLWVVLPGKPLNLLLLVMDGNCQEVVPQMAPQSAFGKGVALLTASLLHVGTVPLLQSIRLVGHSIMVGDMIKGIMTGTQATEVILSGHHKDNMDIHEEAEVPPDTKTGEAEVGAFLAAQFVVVVKGIAAEALSAVLVR